MIYASLAVWLHGMLRVADIAFACAGTSDELRGGLWAIVQAVASGRCEVVW